VAYQVSDGPAHGSDVAGACIRDEVDEPVPLVAVVATHRRGYGPYPVDRHGIRRHYTTTPRLAMDDLTLKAATATDDLSLKSYSDKRVQTV
jgi:hypothetical protein